MVESGNVMVEKRLRNERAAEKKKEKRDEDGKSFRD